MPSGFFQLVARKKSKKIVILIFSSIFIVKVAFLSQNSRFEGTLKTKNIDGNKEVLFRDPTFASLLSLYKLKINNEGIFPVKPTPSFLLITKRSITSKFWKNQLEDISENRCPLPCAFTDDINQMNNVNAIVFYLAALKNRRHFRKIIRQRNLDQPWIILTFEGPQLANGFYGTKYKEFDGIFNRTASYRRDSDIIVPYGTIFNKRDTERMPKEWTISPWEQQANRTKLAAAFISHCNSSSQRLEYIKHLQKYITVDIYGACGYLKCGSRRYVSEGYNVHNDPCYKKIASEYLFYLSFENAICKDYITEKVYNIIHYPVVPVVMGGANYNEILPYKSYINALDFSPKQLARYLVSLSIDKPRYEEYFQWRQHYQSSTWSGVRSLCHLCARLHDPNLYETSIIKNFDFWFNVTAQCHRNWRTNNVMNS